MVKQGQEYDQMTTQNLTEEFKEWKDVAIRHNHKKSNKLRKAMEVI